jgi:hypothetical protein
MFTSTHIRSGARRRIALSLAALSLGTLLVPFVLPATRASAAGSGYNWPVKPFDRPHPVRANFGDPRTTFAGPPTPRGLMTSSGIFELHFGIDIATSDGTAVYPVRSGIASLVNGRAVGVDSGDGFVAEYWHIVPAIRPGQKVEAFKTVLGHVMKGYEHVHFTEIDNRRIVNPLAPGHLGPYQDRTTPRVTSISFRQSDTGPEVLPEFVHGRVVLIAGAYDVTALPVPGGSSPPSTARSSSASGQRSTFVRRCRTRTSGNAMRAARGRTWRPSTGSVRGECRACTCTSSPGPPSTPPGFRTGSTRCA